MKAFRKFIALYISVMLIVILAGGPTTNAATISVPVVKFHTQPNATYKVGDIVSFKVNAPDYNGKVQYRVVLYNNTTKKSQDLWTAGDRYNTSSMPYGKDASSIQWKMSQPGSYKIMVYTKRAGLLSSKTLYSKSNYDSYAASISFSVTAKTSAVSASVPTVKFYSQPELAYKLGDTVSFKVHAPSYQGKVQYRVVLYNTLTKKTQDLWASGDRYNKSAKPYGKDIHNLQWKVSQPGDYKLIVYVKRADFPSSKTVYKQANYDSLAVSTSFSISKTTKIITLDTTKQEVINILGNPVEEWTEEGDTHFMKYKYGEIYLSNLSGEWRVVGWLNGGIPNIALGTKDPSAPAFRIGSSMEDVARAMGTPKFIPPYYLNEDDDYWMYTDESVVFFDKNEEVVSYINKGSLKVFMGNKDAVVPPITYSSKIDDVLKAMGTPDTVNAFFIESVDYSRTSISVTEYPNPYTGNKYFIEFNSKYTYYQYKDSFVAFDENEKIIYFINKGNLNLDFGKKDPNFTGLKIDSTEEDIVKAMGTPDKILDNAEFKRNWIYGDSYIMVDDNGKIVGWLNKGNLNISKNDSKPGASAISLGSTKADVLNAMGTPTRFRFDYWEYGESEILFNDKGVERIYRTNGIKLSNSQKDDLSKGFTIGSSADDVMKAMGTPDMVRKGGYNNKYTEWAYGMAKHDSLPQASVYFDSEGKVVYWNDIYDDSIKFKLSLYPQFNPSAPPITIGSTKDEVLKGMGTPTSLYAPDVKEGSWFYEKSVITFDQNERVVGIANNSKNIKFSLGNKVEGTKFSFGSEKSEVIKAMGTPNSIGIDPTHDLVHWFYDTAWVGIDNNTGRVNSWRNPYGLNVNKIIPDPTAKFKVGSSADDVLKAMGLSYTINIEGKPFVYGFDGPYETYSVWNYGNSRIEFNKDGKVIKWFNNDNNLRVE